MEHLQIKDLLYLLLIQVGVRLVLIKWVGEKLTDAFDYLVRRYIIRSERRLWIWLHHKLGHFGSNALHCEIGGCSRVRPLKPR